MNTQKIAFIFPGQGAQHAAMTTDILACPQAKAVFDHAAEILGTDVADLCQNGEKLNSTAFSQPAIFVVSAALLEAVRAIRPDIKPAMTAGLSMGEYTAMYAAGLLGFAETLTLVAKRGQAMQAAAIAAGGAMVGIMGLDEEKVDKLCAEAAAGQILVPVNFNCPGQIVISGHKDACGRAVELAQKYGAIKAVPLAVAGAFHTESMTPAAEELEKALDTAPIGDPGGIQIIANINAEYYKTAGQIRDGLIKQLIRPILWEKCVRRLIADGATRFYEIGPGRVLTGLMKRIDRKADIVNLSSVEDINRLKST